ncbi:hypothetical protein D3C71_2068390 [compost metagenome]
MAKIPDQSTPIPKSAPTDFDRLFVNGVEINPDRLGGSSSEPVAQLDHIKQINTKDTVDVSLLAKSFNLLLIELQDKGIMKKR